MSYIKLKCKQRYHGRLVRDTQGQVHLTENYFRSETDALRALIVWNSAPQWSYTPVSVERVEVLPFTRWKVGSSDNQILFEFGAVAHAFEGELN